jgi:hypothetical protein
VETYDVRLDYITIADWIEGVADGLVVYDGNISRVAANISNPGCDAVRTALASKSA